MDKGRDLRIAILGAGAAGLAMAIRLKRAGFENFTVYEKCDRVGGTWRDNSYPGSGCDVPSFLYCFSFAKKYDWTRAFAEQPEIQAYFESLVPRFGLARHLRFNIEIAEARFDEPRGAWSLTTKSGETIEADVVVTGLGQLNQPYIPDIPGTDEFQGVRFHSARWNHGVDWAGKRVAVIGNGASAVQFVPEVARTCAHMDIYQRSPNWILPKPDRVYTPFEQWLFHHMPWVTAFYRQQIYWLLELRFQAFRQGTWLNRLMRKTLMKHLEDEIPDPELRAKLTPDYPPGCKRILIMNDYYPTLRKEHVALVTSPIARVTADGVATKDGKEHPADIIIYATGFHSTEFLTPMKVTGRGGLTLGQAWKDGAEAYWGVAVAGFPNFFMLYGPNTNLGHNSILFMLEAQTAYIVKCARALARRGVRFLDVKSAAQQTFNIWLQADIKNSVWAADCGSWYKLDNGKITNNWSNMTLTYWWRLRRPEFADFEFAEARAPAE